MNAQDTLLQRCGLAPASFSLDTLAGSFLAQLRIGIYGGKSSLPMLPYGPSPRFSLPEQGRVAVALCSEAELIVADIRLADGGHTLVEEARFPLPGADYPAPLGDLLYAAAELLEPLLPDCQAVALALPFSLETREEDAAVFLRRPPAELRLSDWEGLDLRATLQEELASRGFAALPCCVLPVVCATQLGGSALHGPGRYLSLHWAEGVDACFTLPKSAILKCKSGETKLSLLCCGSGGFTGAPFGAVDLTMDRDSLYPGEDLLQKMVSLRYLGEQFRFAMIQAAEAALPSFMCGRDFLSLRKLDSTQLLALLAEPSSGEGLSAFCIHEEQDLPLALCVGEAVLERALRLQLAQVLALLQQSGSGTQEAPACLLLSGAAFLAPALRARFEALLKKELIVARGLQVRVFAEEALPYLGAALAALAQSGSP